jgi:hypothetical protein
MKFQTGGAALATMELEESAPKRRNEMKSVLMLFGKNVRMGALGFLVVITILVVAGVAGAAKAYYFACNHQSEGLSGLTGPSRLIYASAQQDEQSHLKAHSDHKGYTTVITNQ